MDENREVRPVPVPVVREQRTLSEVSSGVGEVFTRAGLSPMFPNKIQEMNDAIVHALQFTLFGESAVETVGFTLWPDERSPVVDRYIKPQGKFVLKIEVSPGPNKPQTRLLVCAAKELRNFESVWEGPHSYRLPSLAWGDGHMWRLDQLQRLVSQMFPTKRATVQTVNLRSSGKRESEKPLVQSFSGLFAELTQETLERYRYPAMRAEWEVHVDGIRLPVLYFGVCSPREEMKVYCNTVFFYTEGRGVESERALDLLGELFRDLPNPFNDDAPYEP